MSNVYIIDVRERKRERTMSKVISTYHIINPAETGRKKFLTLEGDNPQNDAIALDKFEELLEKEFFHLQYAVVSSCPPQPMRLDKVVTTEMVSIPLRRIKQEGEVLGKVFDVVDPAMTADLIKEAKENLE